MRILQLESRRKRRENFLFCGIKKRMEHLHLHNIRKRRKTKTERRLCWDTRKRTKMECRLCLDIRKRQEMEGPFCYDIKERKRMLHLKGIKKMGEPPCFGIRKKMKEMLRRGTGKRTKFHLC